jgi:hypothetical protein
VHFSYSALFSSFWLPPYLFTLPVSFRCGGTEVERCVVLKLLVFWELPWKIIVNLVLPSGLYLWSRDLSRKGVTSISMTKNRFCQWQTGILFRIHNENDRSAKCNHSKISLSIWRMTNLDSVHDDVWDFLVVCITVHLMFLSSNRQEQTDRLCGLVARVPGYRSKGPGSTPGATRFSEK